MQFASKKITRQARSEEWACVVGHNVMKIDGLAVQTMVVRHPIGRDVRIARLYKKHDDPT
jgi:hypothetical protein